MALLTKLALTGQIKELRLRPDRKTGFEKSVVSFMTLTFAGPEGDCHTGETRKSDSRTLKLYPRNIDIRNVRQLTLLSVEELADVAAELGIEAIDPGWFGANVLIEGIPDLTLLPPSTRLQFPSGATVVVDMENMPCRQIADRVGERYPDVQSRVVKASTHKRGVTVWVEREGDIRNGDAVSVFVPPQRLYEHGV